MLSLPQIPRVQPFRTTAKGLVGCWPALEGAGPVMHDVSGYGYDLAAAGSPAWADQAWPNGPGTALGLNGSSQYLQLAATGLANFAQAQPFSAVINTTFSASGNGESLISCLDPNNNYLGWELFKASGDVGNWMQSFLINTFPSNCIQIQWNFVPTVGSAYQFALTYNGNSRASGFTLTANGVPVAAQSVLEDNLSAATVSTVPLIVGRRNNATEYHAGAIGETRIYNRALAPSEIWDIWAENG